MNDSGHILISVIIPTFNHAEFLQKAINSVLNQTYTNFEIIVVDNYSTDHTKEVIKGFDDRRLNFYQINNNGVIASSRNYGVEISSGEWVAFLDSDDFWYSSKLESFSRSLDLNPECDVLCSHEYKFNSATGKKKKLRYGPLDGDKYRSLLVYGNRLSPSATAVRKGFINNHNIRFNETKDFITVEDYDYWLQLAYADATFKFIHEFEGEYLVHGENSSGNVDLHKNNELNLMRYHVFKVQEFEKDKDKLWKGVLAILKLRDCFHLLKELKIRSSIRGILQVFLSQPLVMMKWVLKRIEFSIRNLILSSKS